VRSICNRFVTIPTMGEGTSLSLSHASAIIMGEAMRQRLGEVSQTASPDPPHLQEDPPPADPASA
jgi:hypothetical protein